MERFKQSSFNYDTGLMFKRRGLTEFWGVCSFSEKLLLGRCCDARQWHWAMHLFSQMRQAGQRPDAVTYGSLELRSHLAQFDLPRFD